MPTIGERLRNLRKGSKVKKGDLANLLGVSVRALTYYENGDRGLDSDQISKLASFFNVSTDYLLGRTNNPGDIKNEYQVIKEEKIPVYSLDAAGELFAESNIIGWHDVPAEHMSKIAFQVKDDSMAGAGLYPGYTVLIELDPKPQDNQVVVARINKEPALIRRVKYSNDQVFLYPENSQYEIQILNSNDVEIVGVITDAFFKVK